MKIRCGFVSNSSSSSFIVSFPKMPESAEDVLKYLFGADAKNDQQIEYYDNETSAMAIANQVWQDILSAQGSDDNPYREDTVIEGQIIDSLASRYYYSSNGGFYHGNSRFFGTDAKLLDEIANLTMEHDKDSQEVYQAERGYIESKLGSEPDYNKKTAWEKWRADRRILEDKDPQFVAMRKKTNAKWNRKNKKLQALKQQLAILDFAVFKQRHPGFIVKLTYSDNDGSIGSVIEHGDTFSLLPHITINQH